MLEKELRKILKNIAMILELKGENQFKTRAYRNAADIIKKENIDIRNAVETGEIGNIKGFGKALVEKITDYVQHGRMSYYEKLKEEIPEGLLEITKVNGVGPKKAKMLFDKLNIRSTDDLLKAAEAGDLEKVKGFGKATQELIINAIFFKNAFKGKFRQDQMLDIVEKHIDDMEKLDGVKEVRKAGDLLLMPEIMSELKFVVSSDNEFDQDKLPKDNTGNSTIDYLKQSDVAVEHINANGNSTARVILNTGSDEFLDGINKLIDEKNLDIEKYDKEKDIFKALGLEYIPYELREDRQIIEIAKRGLPELLEKDDLKGMLHNHSTWSDGRDSLKDMAMASKKLGFEYFAICDHSKTAAYANGLSPERVLEQHKEIDKLNEEDSEIRILKGIESDILTDGSLDYDDDILERFDLVVASVHSSFRMSESEMTKRIVNALKNKYTTILGHPTGRLLLSRPGYELDIKEIINVAAGEGKVIEINASPYRLDLAWDNVRYAREKGVKIAINPDAHATEGLKDIYYGVTIARKGLLSKNDVINCLNFDEFRKNYVRNGVERYA